MNKRIFISFPEQDSNLRDLLVGQSKNTNSPFDFIDMSVHRPWDSAWKTNCREKIKSCAGLIAIITRNTYSADGQIWEINCAKEEFLPILCIKTSDYVPGNATKEKMDALKEKGRKERAIRVMIVGVPNVGKSSLINKLTGRKSTQTGDRPGVTKGKQWVRLK